ncbi:O-Antigen ligase [Flavobacterium urocaniciphilum]|uniref:O-Antigen ligase n=2 Tax=Flavobacterium urocaniciphilum TaxID=1299341 RepID=A0A1H9BMN5_9FLAO|nr:O-Antigen ligase [Flavobacterium urocaniciphilum]
MNIYSFLANAWQEIKAEQQLNKSFIPFLLILVTLPTLMAINNVCTAIFILSVLVLNRNTKFSTQIGLIFPILLFVWMALSYFWTIDASRTISAISKEITLFLIPVSFLIMNPFTKNQVLKLVKYYSFSMVFYALFFLLRGAFRFAVSGDQRAFFYHGEYDDDFGLVPKLLNAIHISVYVAVAFFYFLNKEIKSKIDIFCASVLFVFLFLLSSKNIIIVFIFLIGIHFFYFTKSSNKMRLRNLAIFIIVLGSILSFSKIKNRFLVEFQSNTNTSVSHSVYNEADEGVNYISIYEAWNNEKFEHHDYFPGTAFRVYQFRMFLEIFKEEPLFWNGLGLNASLKKLQEKEKKYNLYPGYGDFNFHNQYIQNFAELGFIGFLFLITILLINIKNAIKHKDFIHISFAILMISLFLTESFLWRQTGVLYFIIFYCLFNYKNENKRLKIK